MSREHIYETLFIGNIGEEPVFLGKVIKDEYVGKWRELLTPEEKTKYESLSPAEQLQVAMSCNPFRALGAEE